MTTPSKAEVQAGIGQYIKELAEPLRELNLKVGAKLFSAHPCDFF